MSSSPYQYSFVVCDQIIKVTTYLHHQRSPCLLVSIYCFLRRMVCADAHIEGKDPERVARGLKATVNNPGVSDEAKQSAQQRLEDMGANMDTKTTKTTRSKTSILVPIWHR